MSYYDEQPQASDPLSNPRVVTAIVLAIAGLIAIVGCVGLYFFIGGRSAGQPTLVVAVTSLPTNTPSLTPVPSETSEPTVTPGPNDIVLTLASPTTEGFGGGGGPRYATLSEIRGLVEYKNDTVGDWKAATSEVSVPAGTSIRTSESSSVKLTLNEGTVIRVSSQTQFTLSQLTGDEADPTTTLTLDFGKIWNIVVTTPGTTTYEVITPYGKASVRGSFMSTEHNSTEELDIITCLESVKGCSYSVDGVGVQGLSTGQMLIYKKGDALASPEKMDQGQLNDWAPTKVPEVITLTPTATTTGTITPSRTPTITRTPSNTPNREATSNSGGTKTSIAATSTALAGANSGTQTQAAVNQTATQNSGNLTATVYFFNVTATALFQSTQNSFTATSFSFTATAFGATSNANATNSSFTQTAQAASATSGVLTATWVSTIATATQAAANATATQAAALTGTASVPIINYAPASYATSAPESTGSVTLTVQLSNPVPVNIPIDVSFTGGSATGGPAVSTTVDYDNDNITSAVQTGPLTFVIPANQTSATFSVEIADDGVAESNETLQVTIACSGSCAGGSQLGANTTSTVTIVNVSPPSVGFSSGTYSPGENAGDFTVTVNLSRAYANINTVNVSYALSAGSTATSSGNCTVATNDYESTDVTGSLSFAPGVSSQTFAITICDDTTDEPDETINLALTITLGNATLGIATTSITIADNDVSPTITIAPAPTSITEPSGFGTSALAFTVTLSSSSGQTITVNYATSPGTATQGTDYQGISGMLTFTPGTISQPLSVTINGDSLHESAETLTLSLSSPTNATLGTPNSSLVTINDDGDTQPTANFSAVPYEMFEGNSGTTDVVITVNLDRLSGQQIVLVYSTADGGANCTAAPPTGLGLPVANAGSDYNATSGTLTFTPGVDLSKWFTVTVNGDTLVEGYECLTLNLSVGTGDVTLGTSVPSALVIKNDDP